MELTDQQSETLKMLEMLIRNGQPPSEASKSLAVMIGRSVTDLPEGTDRP